MKILMMSRWNAPCGVSVHAEPIGREWVKMGHGLKVLAPVEWDAPLTQPDEPYVVRCYRLDSGRSPFIPYAYTTPCYRPLTERREEEYFFDPIPFLDESYDVFVIENLEILPMYELLQIYPQIKERSKVVFIIHEGGPPGNPDFYKFEPDAVVCFDQRYKNFLVNFYPEKKIHIVPYPCYPVRHGDKREARLKLNLPLDKKIIFNYGVGVYRQIPLYQAIEAVARKYSLVFLTITHVMEWYDEIDGLLDWYRFVELKRGPITLEELYTYLHASDVHIQHKDPAGAVVVSSTVFMTLGSMCPILAADTNFVETLNKEVIKYRTIEELVARFEDVFEGREIVAQTLKAAEEYAIKNSNYEIAKRYIQLFESLLGGG